MSNIKNDNFQQDLYQKYLKNKHSKFNTPDKIIANLVKKATKSSLAKKIKLVEGEG